MTQYIALPSIATFTQQNILTTRFAPSPNGKLHLGHAYAAICAHDFARANGGRFLLRIEDIDGTRSRTEHIETIIADMKWLGLDWDGSILFQSKRVESYRRALDSLLAKGLVYRCICTRSEIAEALKHQPVLHGPDGPHYPGTCRGRDLQESDGPHCWRLDMAAALDLSSEPLGWTDLAQGHQLADPAIFGDIILWRKDAPASYHLAATLDDAVDGITHIVRGLDLFAYSGVHRLLQQLLNLPRPLYWHHPLLLDEKGEKLAKSKASAALAERRTQGEDGGLLAGNLRRGKLPLGISVSNA